MLAGLGEAILAPVSTVLTFDPFAASPGRLKCGCGHLTNPSMFSHFSTHCRAMSELNRSVVLSYCDTIWHSFIQIIYL